MGIAKPALQPPIHSPEVLSQALGFKQLLEHFSQSLPNVPASHSIETRHVKSFWQNKKNLTDKIMGK